MGHFGNTASLNIPICCGFRLFWNIYKCTYTLCSAPISKLFLADLIGFDLTVLRSTAILGTFSGKKCTGLAGLIDLEYWTNGLYRNVDKQLSNIRCVRTQKSEEPSNQSCCLQVSCNFFSFLKNVDTAIPTQPTVRYRVLSFSADLCSCLLTSAQNTFSLTFSIVLRLTYLNKNRGLVKSVL